MAQLGFDYRLAVGSSVALASLPNIEDVLYPYTRPMRIVPMSQPVNTFPVRTTLGSGRVRGDGAISHQWYFPGIKQAAVNHLLNTLLFSGGVVSTAVTIYTRDHAAAAYVRYNAFAVLPVPGQDIEYLRAGVFRLTLRFNDLAAL